MTEKEEERIKEQISKKRIILIYGTSSSGKSTICHYLNTRGYKCIEGDEFLDQAEKLKEIYFKTIPNKFMSQEKRDSIWDKMLSKAIVDSIKPKEKVVIDYIYSPILFEELFKKYGRKNIYIIEVYTDINTVGQNLERRRKEGDVGNAQAVFSQFAELYYKSEQKQFTLGTVNRKEFIEMLKKSFRYEFENEQEIQDFAIDIFVRMGIGDNKDHYIGLRNEFPIDLIFDVSSKTKRQIYKSLRKLLN